MSLSRKLLALAAVLALLALSLQPPAAQAQTVTDEVWSATLTVKSLNPTVNGCADANEGGECTGSLTGRSFQYGGTTYNVTALFVRSNGILEFELSNTPTAATISDLTLNIGDTPFTLSSHTALSGSRFIWTSSGLSWTANTDVDVTLTATVEFTPPAEIAVVPIDWPLIPSGVGLGQQFRLLILTSTTRDGSSTDIDDYNLFVLNRAAAGHEDIQEYSSGFRVVGSTASVDARDNTVTTYTADDKGVAIYWLGGSKVADDYADFYDGSWNSEEPRDESGSVPATTPGISSRYEVLTGSDSDGTSYVTIEVGPLEYSTAIRTGRLLLITGAFTGTLSALQVSPTAQRPFYGLSQIFQVEGFSPLLPGELPEPIDPPPLVVVPSGWELIPDGLGSGEQFRLLFVTSGLYTAESSDIADYNGRVRFNAGRGHGALTAYAGDFRAVGSTASVHAVANTATTFSDANPGVPIYWVKGKKVADDYADFYDGTWDEEKRGRDQKGRALSRFTRRGLETSGVWTGIRVGHELGTSQVVMGLPNKDPGDYPGVTGAGPLASNFTGDGEPDSHGGDLDFAPLYGLSQVFEVGDPATADLQKVPTKPLNPSVATCYVHSWQVNNDNGTPDDDTDDTTETRRRGIPLLLTWDSPASDADESDGIPSYYFYSPYVEVSTDGGGTWDFADGSNATTDQLSYALPYYPVGETLQFRLWAGNANGHGPPSDPAPVTVPRCSGELLSADVTVTKHPTFDVDIEVGYSSDHTGSAISDATFEHSGVEYTVTLLRNIYEEGDGTVDMILNPVPMAEDMADLRLRIDDEEPLPLSDALFVSETGLFRWVNQDAFRRNTTPFSNGATLKVRITSGTVPILTIEAAKSPVEFLDYTQRRVLPGWAVFQVSRTNTSPWLYPLEFKMTWVQAESVGLPPGPRDWTFGAGAPRRTRIHELYFDEHWTSSTDCAQETCDIPTEVTYRLEECPECGYVLGEAREATITVTSALPQVVEEANTQPPTAQFLFQDPQGYHGGAGETFSLRLEFSEAVSMTPEGLEQALAVTNATIEAVSRVDGRSDLWEVRLTPESEVVVTALLSSSTDCDAPGAVCTADGRVLAHAIGTAIPGPPNSRATGAPSISGLEHVEETLTADTSDIADADGLENAVFAYQWIRNDGTADEDIPDANGPSYTLTGEDEGKTIMVRVSFTDDEDGEESLTSDPTGEVAAKLNNLATGAPTISGIVQLGGTLTADTSGIDDEDRLTNAVFSYQWIRSYGGDDTEIAGATGPTYTLTVDDGASAIKVVVSFTDDEGNEETLTSEPTGAFAPGPGPLAVFMVVDAARFPVTELETLVDGGILTLDNPATGEYGIRVDPDPGHAYYGDIHRVELDLDGPKDVDRSEGVPPYSLYGDSGHGYLTGENLPVGRYTLKATARMKNDDVLGILAVSFTVEATAENATATGAPTISGAAQVGATLTADVTGISDDDGLENAVFAYQWTRTDGGSDTNITGATGTTYTLVSDDEGKTIKVTVSFTDGEGNSETLTSDPTGEVEAKPNTKATGAPTIDGIARVGETLTADTSGIDDEDELTNVVFAYQWLADDAEVAGATGAAYTLVAADEGKAIKVVVSFTDDRGNPETLASDPTGAVAPDPGPLTVFTVVDASTDPDTPLGALVGGGTLILGNPTGGEYGVRVDTDSNDDIRKVELALSGAKDKGKTEWEPPYSLYGDSGADNLTGESLPAGSYDLTATAYDANGDLLGTLEVSFSVAYAAPAEEQQPARNTLATGAPTIDGIARVGETLTVDTSGIHDDDGLTNPGFTYQWIRNDGTDDTEIAGATGADYTLTGDDEGKTVKVTVSFTDAEGNPETLTSDPTGEVEAKPNTRATGLPTIDGAARVGETLTADTSGIDDDDGLDNVAFSYQWLRDDAEIAGATGSSYTLSGDDQGGTIKVTVSFTDGEGSPETLTSDPTGEVAPESGPLTAFTLVDTSTDPDKVLGTLEDGIALTLAAPPGDSYGIRVDTDSSHDDHDDIRKVELALSGAKDEGKTEWEPPYSLYGDSGADNLTGESLPAGSYDLTATAYDANDDLLGTLEVSFSVAYAAPAEEQQPARNTLATGAPNIDGTARVGETLTADTSGIHDDDGLTNPGFTYQWIRNDGTDDTEIAGATGADYTLTGDDEGKTVKVTVFFTDAEGNHETLTSDATGVVTAKPNTEATGAPTIHGIARVGETLTADTSGIDDDDGLTDVAFAYQWVRNDGSSDSNIQDATGSSYVLVKADEGMTIKVKVSFTDAEGNPETLTSDPTGEVEAKPNTEATGSPTIDGFARVGETLTADTSGIHDDDELTNVVFSYQWLRNGGSGDTNIQDATGSTYTLVKADEGRTIKVTVSFTDAEGNAESLTSDPTGEVDSEAGPLTGFTLVDTADPDQAVLWQHQTDGGTPEDGDTWKEWTDGGTVGLGDPDNGSYGVTVETESGEQIARVRLELTGDEKSVDRTDDAAPYSLFGDEEDALNDGEYVLTGENLPVGSYTLKATAYTEDDEILGVTVQS